MPEPTEPVPTPPRSRSPMRGLILAQFANTFVNGTWTLLVALLFVHRNPGGASGSLDAQAAEQKAFGLAFLASTLPLVLMSLPAASIADRFRKRSILIAGTAALAAVMALATIVLLIAPDATAPLVALLILIGVQAAFFSPAKYGIVAEIVPHERLSESNGFLELWTFVAIVAGPVMAGPLLELSGHHAWVVALLLAIVAASALPAARAIPEGATPQIVQSSGRAVAEAWGALRADRMLRLAVIGTVVFWCAAKLLGQTLIVDGRTRLGLGETFSGLPLAVLLIGVGVGSVLAGKLSAKKVEIGLIPLGTFLLAGFAIVLGAVGPGRFGTFVLMPLLGIGGGLLLVPLNALVQWRAPATRRGAVLAVANAFLFAGVCTGAALAWLLGKNGFSTRAIFVVTGVALLAGGIWATWLAPQAFLRLVLFLLTHTFYRLRVVGRERVPETGGALLVPNHVSFVDGLLVVASLDRPVRFIVDASFFERPLLGRALRAIGAIPISSAGGPRMILRAFRDAGKYLDEGHLVCIFAEGQITRTGVMNAFRRGLQRIVKGRDVPIVPVHLDNVWGSIFSFAGGRFVWKLIERIPYPVQVSFGAPLPSTTPIVEVRRIVQELGEEAWRARKADRRPMHHSFLRQARKRPWRPLFLDATTKVSRLRAAAGAIALARELRRRIGPTAENERIGLLLPPSIGGAIANLAVTLSGRTSVNLNYTAGPAAMSSAAKQANLRFVLTSPEFLAKAKVDLPEGVTPIFVDEALRAISADERRKALLLALFAPIRAVERACGAARPATVDDVVTVIFSSGSTGEPKGVLLSHFNVDSNVEALAQAFRTTIDDRFLGILPFFHSFGFTATLWFPACRGLSSAFHPSPIDAAAIGALVERHAVTFLLATPTLLSIYLRRCTPAQFGSLRLVLAGAEKLPERLSDAFEDHFGIRPLEGYGATECSPVIAASTFDFRSPGFYQPGWRRGFVGQPIPGVAVRVVDPETFAPLAADTQGLLLVKGPNVMQGYLDRPDLTEKALRDGWYVTGDLAQVDEDGFIKIGDRLARFSKIGGEMVPHGRVEDELHAAAGATTPTFAVTALPDEKKGERLVVVHTLAPERVPEVLAKLSAAGLPNLFIPRMDAFVKVDALPLLGTGKLDLRAVKRTAEAALGAGATSS
jgi:acyl-[acyl-carrier-protein]-phospholipid O-acyltransferase/long-chain-fatty-acid--[acyl-carrier-protein] ligase